MPYALWRMSPEGGGIKPQTAGNDLAHLGSVLSLARAAWEYEINPQAMPDARLVLKRLGYNMKSRERDRRPTLEELDKVLEHFFEMLARRPTVIHMPEVVAFAIFSTRRMDDIARILWEDLDEHRQAVKVRDMKNPGQKIGNDVWCHLPSAICHLPSAICRMRRGRLCKACRVNALRSSHTTPTQLARPGPGRSRWLALRTCIFTICATKV